VQQQAFDVAIVGAGNWGTTLAIMQAQAGRSVLLCTREHAYATALRDDGENRRSLPGYPFPPGLSVDAGFERAAGAGVVLIAVASDYLRATCRAMATTLRPDHHLVSATKGLEEGTSLRVSQVVAQELPNQAERLCVLSGPNLASEIAAGLPAASVLASADRDAAHAMSSLLGTRLFRLYTSDDVIGVELGGALKNVVALAAGICDGLQLGINSKAGIVTRGMAEIVRLGQACGAHPLTFAGLSGYGDLFATCVSSSSRNHYVGECIGRGAGLADVLAGMSMVAEGVRTAPAALALAARHGVELPITAQVCEVLFHDKDPRAAMEDLLSRLARDERSGDAL
jgi:glycerol-3-phosphate dehydrogenase (NAD(P)+)